MENKIKSILFWILIITVISFIAIPIHISLSNEDEDNYQQFDQFTQTFGKSYKTPQEKEKRFTAFKRSLSEIRRLNLHHGHSQHKGGSKLKSWEPGMPKNTGSAVFGLSPFADLTPEEFKSKYLIPKMHIHINKHKKSHHHPELGTPFENLITRKKRSIRPLKVDWRKEGIISPVKQQGSCGACWAFSTVETVESMHALVKGRLEVLSVQQVIDCSKNGNLGCNGGDTCAAIQWMSRSQLASESEYPTTLKTEHCLLQSATKGVRVNSNYSCEGFVGYEDGLKDILANHGPVAVAVDATTWQYYVGGIIQWNCEENLNHAVQVVGYVDYGDAPHYIVRNSWGKHYGDKGYLYVGSGSNLCGIATHVSWLSTI